VAWQRIVLVLSCVVFVAHAILYWHWTEDDAFITFRYAQNLVAGNGLVFNPGERVEGYSNFAWVLLSGLALWCRQDPATVAKVAGILGGIAALLCSWLLARRLLPGSRLACTAGPVFLAITPVLPRHSVTGLETSFYGAVLAAVVLLALVATRLRGWLALVLLLLLLALLRPEGAALALIVLLWRCFFPADPAGRAPAGARWDLGVFVVLFGVYYTWRWVYFGSALPNTFHFKMTGGGLALLAGIHYSLDFLRENGGAALAGLLVAPLLLRPRSRFYLLALALCAAQTGLVLVVGGDWMQHYRFFAPVLPLLAAAAAVGLGVVLREASRDLVRARVWRFIVAVVLLAALVNVYKTERAVARAVLPAVASDSYLYQGYRRVGLWLAENTDRSATVAASDIGAVGFYSGRAVVDMFGLVNPQIARVPGRCHFKSNPEHVLSRRPDYVILVATPGPDGSVCYLRIPDRDLSQSPGFRARYELRHEIQIGYRGERAVIYQRRSD